jgi:hypothetical protein
MASEDGRVFNYGDAPNYGDIRALGTHDVIGLAATAPPLPAELLRASTAKASPQSRVIGAPVSLGTPHAERAAPGS